ncbi:hypothetical protein MNBD_GAMMA12-1661 [hydrothermal vent metagenome]|uniref:Uncharacterized protein n=1 Tax=hydrothermal vent metagenome TaxID=652676 RepID=A0A3B0XXG1_9ZZZZ
MTSLPPSKKTHNVTQETNRIRALLVDRHKLNSKKKRERSEWALFFELRSGTGRKNKALRKKEPHRYIDAFAINLWPSKKHRKIAYEIKVSRADFLKELKSPEKRQWASEISHQFYFIAPQGIIRTEELPEGCGLLEVIDDTIIDVIKAPLSEARDFSMTEMCAVARQAMNRELLTDKKFKYLGSEITESDLDELTENNLSSYMKRKIQKEVDVRINDYMKNKK